MGGEGQVGAVWDPHRGQWVELGTVRRRLHCELVAGKGAGRSGWAIWRLKETTSLSRGPPTPLHQAGSSLAHCGRQSQRRDVTCCLSDRQPDSDMMSHHVDFAHIREIIYRSDLRNLQASDINQNRPLQAEMVRTGRDCVDEKGKTRGAVGA